MRPISCSIMLRLRSKYYLLFMLLFATYKMITTRFKFINWIPNKCWNESKNCGNNNQKVTAIYTQFQNVHVSVPAKQHVYVAASPLKRVTDIMHRLNILFPSYLGFQASKHFNLLCVPHIILVVWGGGIHKNWNDPMLWSLDIRETKYLICALYL